VLNLGAGLDLHPVALTSIKFDGLFDNEWDFNALTAAPAGLGLTLHLDGSSSNITTTATGVWSFTFSLACPAADAGVRAVVVCPFAGLGTQLGPVLAAVPTGLATQVVALPAGATSQAVVNVTAAATANPFTVTPNLCIARLA